MLVHAGFEAASAIIGTSMRRHCNDRNQGDATVLERTDRVRRCEPIHLGHLNIHQHQVDRSASLRRRLLPKEGQRFEAVGDDRDGNPHALQQLPDNVLVQFVVLRHQDTGTAEAR